MNFPKNISFLVADRGGYKTTYLTMLRRLSDTLYVTGVSANVLINELRGKRNLTVLVDEPYQGSLTFTQLCAIARSVDVSGIKFLVAINHAEYAQLGAQE